jgi:hypothetical protein
VALSALVLAASLILLLLSHRQLHRHLQGLLYLLTRSQKTALILYALLFFPGVLLHEGSHWLAAKLLRVPTRGFSLFPRKSSGGMIRFGYVETATTDPLRGSLIGLAPLVSGGLAMVLIALEGLGLRQYITGLASGQQQLAGLQPARLLATPDLLLWLYLAFAIGNTMLPSKSDRASWASALIVVAALAFIGTLLGLFNWSGAWLQRAFEMLAENLAGIFLVTVVLDGLLLLPILLLEAILSRILGRKIVYGG